MSIYLPASPPQELPVQRSTAVQAKGGKILLMDDEEYILDVNGEILQELGYVSVATHDGGEALAAYKDAMNSGHRFDAVIMDLTIPRGMGGKEMMSKLLEIDPQAKGIVSSGYSNDPVMANYRDFGFKGVVPKPYKIADMAKVLAKVLLEDPSDK
jgi:CheY-like chemotaxis protein